MNCTEACPKGLNPARAIANTKRMMAERGWDHQHHWNREARMRIGLFIPCYIDAFFPEVGIATLELLERFGHEVVYPRDQTCCGQPMANSGFNAECADTEALFVRNFSGFDYVVAPSGSCVHQVRDNFDAIEQTPEVREVRARTFELVELLHDIQKVETFPWARFPHRVGLHNSCGTLKARGVF
jgi:L-lactate dehydrogenase complex protein LldE